LPPFATAATRGVCYTASTAMARCLGLAAAFAALAAAQETPERQLSMPGRWGHSWPPAPRPKFVGGESQDREPSSGLPMAFQHMMGGGASPFQHMMGGGAPPAPHEEESSRKCQYLTKLKNTAIWRAVGHSPRFQKMERDCEGPRREDGADASKERMETRCAWLQKLVQRDQLEFLESQHWFHGLDEMCAIVPQSELTDNNQEINEQTCVWMKLFEKFGKHHDGRAQNCGPEADEKANELAMKVHQALGSAKNMFAGDLKEEAAQVLQRFQHGHGHEPRGTEPRFPGHGHGMPMMQMSRSREVMDRGHGGGALPAVMV